MLEELPSKLAVAYEKTAGRFVSFKALLVIVTALWLWQSFLWGGMYTGCGLAVAVSIAVMAGLVVRDYISQGSMVSRLVGGGGGRDEGAEHGGRVAGGAAPGQRWPSNLVHRFFNMRGIIAGGLVVDVPACFPVLF